MILTHLAMPIECRWGAWFISLAMPLPLSRPVGTWPLLAPPLSYQPIGLAHMGVGSFSHAPSGVALGHGGVAYVGHTPFPQRPIGFSVWAWLVSAPPLSHQPIGLALGGVALLTPHPLNELQWLLGAWPQLAPPPVVQSMFAPSGRGFSLPHPFLSRGWLVGLWPAIAPPLRFHICCTCP